VTVGKHFKHRVRERMAATGENYMTARRALEQEQAAKQAAKPVPAAQPVVVSKRRP